MDTDAGCNPCSRLFAASGAGGGTGTPRAAVDEACASDPDCAEGLYCLSSSTTADGGETCRVCKPLRALGGNCGDPPYVPCAKGLWCDDGFCAALSGAGAACTSGGTCLSGFCHPTTNLCDSGGRPGDACTATADCRQGYCDTVAGRCADTKPNGAACAAPEQCQTSVCDPGTGRCGKPDGATCNSSYECQHTCDTSARTCGPGLADGASCTSSDRCESKLCHGNLRVCVTPCPDTGDCAAGTFCDSYGACLPAAANGASCDQDDECSSGFCNSNDTCATRPGLGDACTGTLDCFPKGRCVSGTCQALAKPGEACSGFDSCMAPFLCQDGTCQRMSLTCEAGAPGQKCAWLQVCDANSYCDVLNDFTCAEKKGSGTSCLRSVECGDGLYCESGSCAPYASAGEACGGRTTCAPGLFCDEAASPEVCTAPKPVGASCQDDAECQTGDCAFAPAGGLVCQPACVPVPRGEQPSCHPSSCGDFGYDCGSFDAGCGLELTCGRCTGRDTCGGAGQVNVCGCTPTAACLPRQCNTTVDDGCGRQLNCPADCGDAGTCGGGSTFRVCGCPSDRTAGPSYAAVAVSRLTPQMSGGFTEWDAGTFGNIAFGDDAGVYVFIQPPPGTSTQSQYLVASGFGFNLPPTASVNGVEVRVRRSGTGNTGDRTALMMGNVVLGSGGSSVPWPTTWTTQRFGGQNALWNHPLTVAEVNSPDFGFGVAATCVGTCEFFVDWVEVTVHYAYRCDCDYACKSDSECGDDGCGGTCGAGGCGDAGTCTNLYCVPPVFVDQAMGLMWLNEQFDRASCSGISAAGYSDWRAPTIDELRTRVVGCPETGAGGACPVATTCTQADAGCLTTACDGCAYRQGPAPYGCYLDNHTQWIACTGAGPFFSSTRDGTVPWVIDFGTGRISPSGGAMTRYRCVRP